MNSARTIAAGTKDVTLAIRLFDATTGLPKTGVTIANLDLYYIRVETDNDVTISAKVDVAALTGLTDAHTDNKAYEIGEGYYRVDIPDAVCAAGARFAAVTIKDGTGGTILNESVDIILATPGEEFPWPSSQDKTTGAISYYAPPSLAGLTYDHTGGTVERQLTGSNGDFTGVIVGDFIFLGAGAGGGVSAGVYEVEAVDAADAAYVGLVDHSGLAADDTAITAALTIVGTQTQTNNAATLDYGPAL